MVTIVLKAHIYRSVLVVLITLKLIKEANPCVLVNMM